MLTITVTVHDDAMADLDKAKLSYSVSSDGTYPNLPKLIQAAADGALDQFVRIGRESWLRGRVLTPDEIEAVLALDD